MILLTRGFFVLLGGGGACETPKKSFLISHIHSEKKQSWELKDSLRSFKDKIFVNHASF